MQTTQQAPVLTVSLLSVQKLNDWSTHVGLEYRVDGQAETLKAGVIVVDDRLQSVNLFYLDSKSKASASSAALPNNKVGSLNVEHGFALDNAPLELVEVEVRFFLANHFNN